MKKIVFAFLFGALTPAVYILGATPFAARGRTSFAEVASGCVALACYLSFCQFKLAPRGEHGGAAKWPAVVAMAAPLVAGFAVMVWGESYRVVVTQGLPMLAAGCCGIAIGAVLAARQAAKRKAPVT